MRVGKRLPYVSLPFCPLHPPPPQLSLPITVLVPSSPSSSPAHPSSTQEPAMGGISSLSPRISFSSLLLHPWPLATLSGSGSSLLSGSQHLWPLLLHLLPHASLKGEAGAGSVPPGSRLFFPRSGYHLGPHLLSAASDPALLSHTSLNWLRPCTAHTQAGMPSTGTYPQTHNRPTYSYTWGSR